MARSFLVPIQLPGDPGAPEHAARKAYVDAQVGTRMPAALGGAVGQVLTKTGAGDHVMAWADVPRPGGLVDCSAMTYTSQVNAASAAAPAGSQIWLGRRPGSAPLLADVTLIRRPYQQIRGLGGRSMLTVIRADAALPAGQPIVAAQGYMTSAATCDNPSSLVGVHIDAAGKTDSHGSVVYGFWCHDEDVQVANCAGPNAKGILATDRGINATTITSNSHSENTFERCRFDTFTAGASGFWAESYNGASNQDGHLKNCFFAGIPGYGTRLGRAAGWSVENNHYYGIGFDAISMDGLYSTKVVGNYIEDFGGQDLASPGAPTFGYYSGIAANTVLDTRASIIALNTVSVDHPAAPVGNRWACFSARAGAGQLRANLVMVGNTATWAKTAAPTTTRAHAFWLGEGGDTGRMLDVEWAGNQIESLPAGWWAGTRTVNAMVTISEPATSAAVALKADDTAVVHLSGTETIGGAKTFSVAPAVPVGSLLTHPVRRDDARLTDARTPLAHKATHATGGADALTPADIGAQPAGSYQAADADLTTIAGLAPADGAFLKRVAGAWAGSTLAKADVGLSAVDNTSDAAKPVSTATQTALDGKAAATHTHAATDITSGVLAAARLPVVTSVVRPQTFAATPTVDPAVQGNLVNLTATADITALAVSTVGATDRQSIELAILASGAARNVTFAAAIRTSTGITRGAYAVPSGQVLIAGLKYVSLVAAWVLVAATISAT